MIDRRIGYKIAVFSFLAQISVASACDIPVFQYARDYWEPDYFEVFVYHRGPLEEGEQRIVDRFANSDSGVSDFNYSLETIDVSDAGPETVVIDSPETIQEGHARVEVLSPRSLAGRHILWEGPLSEETFVQVTRSPMRKKIADQLMAGRSAVWVLLESGNPDLDDAAFEKLEKHLDEFGGRLEFTDLSGRMSEVRLSFVIERLARDNPEEAFLIEMLLSTEPDLKDEVFKGLPMAFPVFGRGRVLYALIGQGINEDTIRDACEFLTGACSCEIKALNPGADLLLAADWESGIRDTITGLERENVLSTTSKTRPLEASTAMTPEPVVRNLLIAVAILTGAVVLGTILLLRNHARE